MQKSTLRRSGAAWLGAAMAALLLVSAGPAAATSPEDQLDLGPRVGATIPNQLAARDQTGRQQSFRTLRGRKGLVLLFNRSFNW